MRLRFIGQAVSAATVSLGIVLGIAACGQDNTIDYVYVTNAKNNPGQINVFLVDSLSGQLRQIKESPFPAGRNPQDLVATSNGKYIYVVNHDDNTILEFAVGTDAKIYPIHTYQTPGSNPTALTVDYTGTYLFVTDAFQPQYSASLPGPGALVIYPINETDGSLGTPLSDTATGTPYFPTCNNPVAVSVLNNNAALNGAYTGAVYVVNDPGYQPFKIANTVASSAVGANGTSTIQYAAVGACSATAGQITAYSLAYSSGATPAINAVSTITSLAANGATPPFAAGGGPNAIVSDTTGSYVYVTDQSDNQLLAYTVGTTAGVPLTLVANGTYSTGNGPDAITLEPTNNSYLYVANYNDNSVSIFPIGANGVPGPPEAPFGTATGPASIYIEPNSYSYIYTGNFLSNSVSGMFLNSSSGALNGVQGSPVGVDGQPTAIAAVTHHSKSAEAFSVY